MKKTSALSGQIAGTHYRSMKIQPMEFSMANGWDACAHTVLKYLSRYPAKGGLEDLRKAEHSLRLRNELGATPVRGAVIDMADYCNANKLSLVQTSMLTLLEEVVQLGLPSSYASLLALMQTLIADMEDQRMDVISQNGNDGLHYQSIER